MAAAAKALAAALRAAAGEGDAAALQAALEGAPPQQLRRALAWVKRRSPEDAGNRAPLHFAAYDPARPRAPGARVGFARMHPPKSIPMSTTCGAAVPGTPRRGYADAHVDVVRLLLEAGADPRLRSTTGGTARDIAAQRLKELPSLKLQDVEARAAPLAEILALLDAAST
ncbi:unnamed protein product [Prorocentrum cordatum]|uniref:Uncharacterized protein n=1 Tax=Prorocentrum cordatum TaxID=2364126 RepID=A0ABN9WSV3_9DINO|nr:unnamed protein product [Polarella glacialis]